MTAPPSNETTPSEPEAPKAETPPDEATGKQEDAVEQAVDVEAEDVPLSTAPSNNGPLGGRGEAPVVDTAPTNTGPRGGRGHWDGFQTQASQAGQGPVGGRGDAPEADSSPTNEGPIVPGNAPLGGNRRGG
jgi:hypothetical protein